MPRVAHTVSAVPRRMSHSHLGASPELLDSTSDLLAALRLNPGKNDLGTDLVLEVPDTPERSSEAGSIDGSPSSRRGGHVGKRLARLNSDNDLVLEVPDTPERLLVDGSPSRHRVDDHGRRWKDSGSHIVGGNNAVDDTERVRRHAKLKRLISMALDTKASPESPRCKFAKTDDVRRASRHCVSTSGQSGASWRKKGMSQRGESSTGLLLDRDDVEKKHRDGKMRRGSRCLGNNGGLSRCTTGKSKIQSNLDGRNSLEPLSGDIISSFAGIGDQDNLKPVGMCRLYGNLNKNDVSNNVGMTSGECLGVDLADRISISSSESETHSVDRNKGKLKLDENTSHSMQREKAKTRADRACWISDKEVTAIADGDDTSRSHKDLGWRTTRNRIKRAQSFSSDETAGAVKLEDTNTNLSAQSRKESVEDMVSVNLVHDKPEIVVSRDDLITGTSQTISEFETVRRRHHRRQKLSKEKGNYNSLNSNRGESSSSIFEESGPSYPQSSRLGPYSKPANLSFRHHGTAMGSVIDVDEVHFPEPRLSSPCEQSYREDDSRQVESDEILARQLQEEFYLESSGPGGMTETDVAIALSLQEEDARRPAPIRRSPSYVRDAAMSHLYRDYSDSSFQRTSAQFGYHARVPTSRIETQLRRAFNSPEEDIRTRFSFLEALENAFDDSDDTANFNFQTQRDFNENDYEMLLALDDHNHEHVGATEGQINSLPHSVIQSKGISEACTICLEPPSVGDVVRHLPCLHKFHKECIDTWLRRKAVCPICKSATS